MPFETPTLAQLRATGSEPYFFGLGFVQLRLSETQRLHFWHPDCGQTTPEEELHDHRYDFHSRVLAGTVIHEVWSFTEDAGGDTEAFRVSCKPGAPADPVPFARGSVKLSGRYTLPAGSEYDFPADQFHRSVGIRAVTLLTRGPTVKENATVLHPVGAPTVCAFSVKKSTGECWRMIADLLPRNG